jgi:hypothetical protein
MAVSHRVALEAGQNVATRIPFEQFLQPTITEANSFLPTPDTPPITACTTPRRRRGLSASRIRVRQSHEFRPPVTFLHARVPQACFRNTKDWSGAHQDFDLVISVTENRDPPKRGSRRVLFSPGKPHNPGIRSRFRDRFAVATAATNAIGATISRDGELFLRHHRTNSKKPPFRRPLSAEATSRR